MRKFAELQAKQGNGAYVYYFTRVPPALPDRPSRGATHVAEIPYMFDNLAPPVPWTDVDRRLADVMSSYWVNFARSGDPNGAGLAGMAGLPRRGDGQSAGSRRHRRDGVANRAGVGHTRVLRFRISTTPEGRCQPMNTTTSTRLSLAAIVLAAAV